jgi:ubiquinone/menaquinone biosynthesis C-methylase UbiE
MPGYNTTQDFDERAATWDEDPDRRRRASVVAARINELVRPTPATRVLEYGAGTGLLSFALKPYVGPITMADISTGMLAEIEKKIAASGMSDVRSLRLDLTTDPVPPERYDLVCLQLILHHILDTDQILRALRETLVPGGTLAIADLDTEDGTFHREAYEGYFGFDRAELGDKARAAGFQDVRFDDVVTIQKERGGRMRDYSMFLMLAQNFQPAPAEEVSHAAEDVQRLYPNLA